MSSALAHLLRRLGWAAIVIAGVTAVSFAIAYLLPGDAARMLVGPQASAADIERARAIYALDRPVPVQFVRFVRRLVHVGPERGGGPAARPAVGGGVREGARGDPEHRSCAAGPLGVHLDLGYSFHYRRPVVDLLEAKVPRTVELALAALLVQLLLGLSLGIVAAARRGTAWEDAALGLTLLGASAPTFVIGPALQYALAYKLRLLPYDGYGVTAADHLRSLVLPALTLGVFGSALYARMVREELRTLLRQDFIRTARAKGASRLRALVVHALRNALLPLTTLAALDFGALAGGAIVTERLFRWPGVGSMAVEALQNRDGPLLVGTVLFAATAVVLATVALDLAAVALDPRLRSRGR
ncbi:peptide ABC transporter [Sorangium cellulosum]|uniref:Peptide ABC transporter n=1 Tax=Sorangium cellulosum TaxID=56 RepID=A0A2L0EUL4_SORCE|nr:ABC transporter permease [Sorangium cellulosum]AUX42983.1 peptide ABC transporter [Sorangium cellulosum]